MSDLIDRQAAIDSMTNTLWHYPNECYRNLKEYEFAKGLSELGLKSVPSAQPYTEAEIQKIQDLEQAEIQKAYELGKLDAESRWIPCSEKLPEYSGRYLVSVLDGIDRRTTVAPYHPQSRTRSLTGRMAYWKVIAWMPLPEPYKERREE